MNIRIWKNVSWRPVGLVGDRQQRAIDYREKLVEKFQGSSKIRRIHLHRHLPKYILNSQQRRQEKIASKHTKKQNVEASTGLKQNTIPEKQVVVENIGVVTEEAQLRKKRARKAQTTEEAEE